MKKILVILSLCLAAIVAPAQNAPYKFDFGGALGMSSYLGEANSTLFANPGFAAEAGIRYLPNVRWAFRGTLGYSSLSGSTKKMDGYVPGDQPIDFSSSVISLGATAEFNFFPYGIGETYKQLKRWTPYLSVGIGACMAAYSGGHPVALTMPMGFGVKYKVKPRLNLYLEFSMTKAFGDKLDGPYLNDLAGIKTSFFKNTDWYSRLCVGITYEFGERCETCHYVD